MKKNRQLLHQNRCIFAGGTSVSYPKQGFRYYFEIKYYVEICERIISCL